MAVATSLTSHDRGVLEKIKDPESGPSSRLLIDDSLPRDPHITDAELYNRVMQRERDLLLSIQQLELQIAGLKPSPTSQSSLSQYRQCISKLDRLIIEYPNYASARNNRAQALRRVYGDAMLLKSSAGASSREVAAALDTSASDSDVLKASKTVLCDLDTAISLLTPQTPFAAISSRAAKTLSQAYTQRGALYHLSAKCLSSEPEKTRLRMDETRKEAVWSVVEFEENASRDFMLGGRYGNEIARALAVSTNPTAKLCGDMVREAMKKEYAGDI